MNSEQSEEEPRLVDEWRVEVELEADEHHRSLGERLRALDLDDEARERLGGSVIVTRDGSRMFLYAWHEQSAREAERVIRDLLESEKLSGEVQLMRWHPVEDAWRPAAEPLPGSEGERDEEAKRHAEAEATEQAASGEYEWQVVVELDELRATRELAHHLTAEGLPVKRRWKYVLVGALTEEAAIDLAERLEGEAPEGSRVAIRANPDELPLPVFVQLGSLKPGVMRDLGL
jgi:hypothetical protein